MSLKDEFLGLGAVSILALVAIGFTSLFGGPVLIIYLVLLLAVLGVGEGLAEDDS